MKHDMDDDGYCWRCGFDGAEWHSIYGAMPKGERPAIPECQRNCGWCGDTGVCSDFNGGTRACDCTVRAAVR